MSFQQCRFNFGLEAFRYPPRRQFHSFNEHGSLKPQDKVVLPSHIYLEHLRKVSVREDSCTLCFDRKAVIRLDPCHHKGFCVICAQQLNFCPMCRAGILEKCEEITTSMSSANEIEESPSAT